MIDGDKAECVQSFYACKNRKLRVGATDGKSQEES
jgi:hypothetical protein